MNHNKKISNKLLSKANLELYILHILANEFWTKVTRLKFILY